MNRYARKRRQFSFLIKKIDRLKQANWSGLSETAKYKLIYRAKKLFGFLKNRLKQQSLRKAMVVLGVTAGMLTPNLINAQETDYAEPVRDAFGMNSIGQFQSNVFADFDSDGDLDLLSQAYLYDDNYDGIMFLYSENIGNAFNPGFTEPVVSPFGIVTNYSNISVHTVVDVDNDGDLDILVSREVEADSFLIENRLVFLENIGTELEPDFAGVVENAFNIEPQQSDELILGVTHADMDNDGDFDLLTSHLSYNEYDDFGTNFYYYENVGDVENPSFTEPVLSPFGLGEQSRLLIGSTFVDFDKDGDMDVVGNVYTYSGTNIIYFENIGNESNAGFTSGAINPASLASPSLDFAISFADLDNDGDMDAVTTPFEVLERTQFFENLCIVSNVNDLSVDYDITLSPNPSSDIVNVTIEGENGSLDILEVYDLLGANVLSREIRNAQFYIDVSQLRSGQYFMLFKNKDGVVTKKLMIH